MLVRLLYASRAMDPSAGDENGGTGDAGLGGLAHDHEILRLVGFWQTTVAPRLALNREETHDFADGPSWPTRHILRSSGRPDPDP